jgi:cysteine desulfurase / selenocysteine lyase
MLGISGVGFLYVAREVLPRLRPVLVGWRSTTDAWNFNRAHFELRTDALKLEEGSQAYTGIYALSAALELLLEVGAGRIAARIRELLVLLDGELRALGCDTGPAPEHRAGILTFLPRAGDPRALYGALAERDVSLSLRRGRLRVSPHFYNRPEELEQLVRLVRGFNGG